jgi:predicted Zn-dependent protease
MLEVERGQADAFTWAGLAACAFDRQDTSDAKEKLRNLEKADENDKNLALLQIELAWRERRFEKLPALFDKAQTALGDEHPLTQAFFAYQHYLEGRNDLALAAAHKSLVSDVTLAQTHTIRGLVYMLADWQEAINKYQAAAVNFQIAERLEPDEPFAYALEALAQMYDNHAELAEKAAHSGLKESPKDALLYICLAAAQQEQKDLSGSRDSLQKARELDPQNYSFADPPKLSDLYKLILRHGRRPTLLLPLR